MCDINRSACESQEDLNKFSVPDGCGPAPRYGLLGDPALCRLAQEGDQRATEQLLRRHKGWIRRCADSWQVPGQDWDDVYSLALTGTFRAIETYDPSRRARLPTYIWYAVRRECEHAIQALSRANRGIEPSMRSLSEWEGSESLAADAVGRSLEESVVGEIEGQRLLRVLLEAQSGASGARNQAVIEGLLDGDGLVEIGQRINISKQWVNKIRKRFQNAYVLETKHLCAEHDAK